MSDVQDIVKEFRDTAPVYTEKFVVAGREVVINPSDFFWNETTVNDWMARAAALNTYLGQVYEDAGDDMEEAKREHLKVYNEKFIYHKENGAANDLARARSENEPEVIEKDKVLHKKKKVHSKIKTHLNSLYRSMALAENRANTLRKEMEKLHYEENLEMYQVGQLKNDSG